MFANHPLAMVRHREMQTEALLRDATAYRDGLLALRGRARRETARRTFPVPAPSLLEQAPSPARRSRTTPALEPAPGN